MLNQSECNGGAARAAYRTHRALLEMSADSKMGVNSALFGDGTVQGPPSGWGRANSVIRQGFGEFFAKCQKTPNSTLHSPAILPSCWPNKVNESDADVVHLHWINREMLSIADVARIRKPTVWTLHDMWAFCGAEHTSEDFRWIDGYSRENRPVSETGFDLNRWTWQRKKSHWTHPIQIVSPSNWLANCVRESALMGNWPVEVIPNPLNTEMWQPIDKKLARELIGLPDECPLLLFGAMGGTVNPLKGFDLLLSALEHLQGEVPGMQLLIFGQLRSENSPDYCFPTHYVGHMHDDVSLRILYSAADVFVNPSRQESFGQTASEAHACGTPVVCFDNSGLVDIVEHHKTGYLAKAFDSEDLASGIRWVLEQPSIKHGDDVEGTRLAALGINARQKAVDQYSYPVVAKKYMELYSSVIDECR